MPPEPLTGPISLKLIFWLERPKSAKTRIWPTKKPDIDNLEKAVLDAMNPSYEVLRHPVTRKVIEKVATFRGFWKDDCQVVEVTKRKLYALPGRLGSVEVTIAELQD